MPFDERTSLVEPVFHGDDQTTVYGLFVWCEGCDSRHYVPVIPLQMGDGRSQASWTWNNSFESPTFAPSILVYEAPGHHPRCHSFIREGVWEYLTDSTHDYAGTTRPLAKLQNWPVDSWPNG